MSIVAGRQCAAVVISLLIFFFSGCTKTAPVSERELATRVLAEEVAKVIAPKKVLVISNPFSRESGRPPEVYEFEKAGISGLQEGFGEGAEVEVDFPALKPEVLKDPGSVQVDAQTTTPLSFLVVQNAFSALVQKHSDADLVVSLIGLPVNLVEFPEWTQPGKPQFALLLPDWRMIGGKEAILQSFRSRKLAAAVVRKPNSPEGEIPGDSTEAFHQRYWLVTPENVEKLLAEHPAAFGLR